MRILDKYLIKQFCFVMLFSLIAIRIIFLIVDLVEKLDKFIDGHSTLLVIANYYIYNTPYVLVLVLPVAMLLSCLFSLGQLAKHNELTAMKSAGISLNRILAPLFILSFLISIITLIVGESLIPLANRKMMEVMNIEVQKGKRSVDVILQNVFVQGSGGIIYHLASYDTKSKTGANVLVQRFADSRLKEEIQAKRVVWKDNGWLFESGVEMVFSDSAVRTQSPLNSAATDTISSAARLAENIGVGMEKFQAFDKLFRMDLKIKPEALTQRQKKTDEMGYFELAKYVKLKERSGQLVAKEATDLNLKISYPLINFIIVLLGAPIAANPKRSGLVVGFAISLFIAFVYFFFIKMGQSLGYSEKIPPLLAAWITNILFAILGVVLLVRAKK